MRWDRHGAFAKALIDAIGEGRASIDPSGRITTDMLDLYLADHVKELTRDEDTVQYPIMNRPAPVPDFPLALAKPYARCERWRTLTRQVQSTKVLSSRRRFFVCSVGPIFAKTAVGWPDAIDLLAQQRSQAETCAELLKSSGDKAAVTAGRITYNAAKAKADGVIAGVTVALVEGGNPQDLPKIEANLEKAGAGLPEVCDAAAKSAYSRAGPKAWWRISPTGRSVRWWTGSSRPQAPLWTRHVEKDQVELETIKAQLEAAKWPNF